MRWQDEFASAEIAALMTWTPKWTEDQLYTARDLVAYRPPAHIRRFAEARDKTCTTGSSTNQSGKHPPS